MNSKEIQRLIAADIELSSNGLRITEFATKHGVATKTVRRLLDFMSAEFDVVLEFDRQSYCWHYARNFRIFNDRLKG